LAGRGAGEDLRGEVGGLRDLEWRSLSVR
jgi:hypothetical protein